MRFTNSYLSSRFHSNILLFYSSHGTVRSDFQDFYVNCIWFIVCFWGEKHDGVKGLSFIVVRVFMRRLLL